MGSAAGNSAVNRGRAWKTRRGTHLLLAALLIVIPSVPLLLWRTGSWLLLAGKTIVHLSASVLALIAAAIVLHYVLQRGSHSAATRHPRSRSLSLGLGIASAAIAISGELALHFAAINLHHFLKERMPNVKEFYANHDLARLVGHTIGLSLEKTAKDLNSAADAASLHAIAVRAPEAWLEMVERGRTEVANSRPSAADEPALTVAELTEPRLTDFVADPARTALNPSRWESLLNRWARDSGVQPLSPEARRAAAADLAGRFGVSFREAVKHDFENQGKAFAALQLDIAGRLLTGIETSAAGTELARQASVNLEREIVAVRKLLNEIRTVDTAEADRLDAQFAGLLAQTRAVIQELVPLKLEQLPELRWFGSDSGSGQGIDLLVPRSDAPMIRDGDRFQLVAHFSRACWVGLLVLDTDGAKRWSELGETRGPIQFPPNVADKIARYRCNTGPGIQVFLLIAADNATSLGTARIALESSLQWNEQLSRALATKARGPWLLEDGVISQTGTKGEIETDVGFIPSALPGLALQAKSAVEGALGFGIAVQIAPRE